MVLQSADQRSPKTHCESNLTSEQGKDIESSTVAKSTDLTSIEHLFSHSTGGRKINKQAAPKSSCRKGLVSRKEQHLVISVSSRLLVFIIIMSVCPIISEPLKMGRCVKTAVIPISESHD